MPPRRRRETEKPKLTWYEEGLSEQDLENAKKQKPEENNNNNDNRCHNNNKSFPGWSETASLKDGISGLFMSENLADVYFTVGKDSHMKRLPAHKFVLSNRSSVFHAMFHGPAASDNTENSVPDVDPDAFVSVLKFLYTDEIQVGPENVTAVLYAAEKYAITPVILKCTQFFVENLAGENVFTALSQARFYAKEEFADKCLKFIDENPEEVFASEDFLEINNDTLHGILERDSIQTRNCEEVLLFKSVIRWAEAECRRRNIENTPANHRLVIDKCLYSIRFPLMTSELFASIVVPTGVLTKEEVISVFQYSNLSAKPVINFPVKRRAGSMPPGPEYVAHRFRNQHQGYSYFGDAESIGFRVDQHILLTGIGLYGSSSFERTYHVTVHVTNIESGSVLASMNNASYTCDSKNGIFRVMFDEPLEIEAEKLHNIYVKITGQISDYGTDGKPLVTVDLNRENGKEEDVLFFFEDSAGPADGTGVTKGQIPEIFFHLRDD